MYLTMTYSEFQTELINSGLSIKDFASLIGMHPNSVTNYKSKGVLPLNLSIIVALISELKGKGIDPEPIIEQVKRKHLQDIVGVIAETKEE